MKRNLILLITLLCVLIHLSLSAQSNSTTRSFIIDYENNQFLKDGQPFRYVSGEMHYFRVHNQYWMDRFNKMKSAGLNAVQTYIEWSQHEPQPGVYNFDGNLDIESFFQAANESGLYVIVRAGPYICGARDMGGFPYWLLQQNPNMKLRTSDPSYIQYVDSWLEVLLPKIKPYLYENDGPIISIQVENEYGSYPACDVSYMVHLRDKFRDLLGDSVVLFTTDGNDDYYLRCGKTPGLYATVDFGPGSNVNASFEAQRTHEPSGPLVNSEYYPGWDDNWGYPHDNTAPSVIANTLDQMLTLNASVSMYMFTGGTSLGFTNGAVDGPFRPYTTTYDYNAPISEAGDTTNKYLAIRDVISKYLPVEPIPTNTSKYAYGSVSLTWLGSIFDLSLDIAELPRVLSQWPLSFEELGQAYGYVLYETIIHTNFMQPSFLVISNISDRGYVFVDQVYVGIVSRMDAVTQLPIRISVNQTLQILVENQGRIDYGQNNNDFKGIYGINSVTIASKPLTNWTMTKLSFDGVKLRSSDGVESLFARQIGNRRNSVSPKYQATSCPIVYPAFFSGAFLVPDTADQPVDTFLHLPGWSKGLAFINGVNLGRYWPSVGPQMTLFIPKFFINPYPQTNQIVLFEHENSPCATQVDTCEIQLIDEPILIGATPYSVALKTKGGQLVK
ncbi:hypothetical protein CHUAL_013282 [Chamberlinius hualienensis]